MSRPSLFSGLRVVELASVLAGPAVGQFFAELGAEVIKVENRRAGGDVTRHWKLPTEDPADEFSAYYHSVNYGKQTHLLDLEDPAERAQVEAWLQTADIVLSNFKPDSARRLGMDYERLSTLNPRLIYAELYAFGPADERPAFDVVLQAETGFLAMTGEPYRPPVKMPVALIDLLAAHQLKEGILVALLQRERTNRGGRVSTSLYASALASLANQATNWLIGGVVPGRMGARHPNIAPYGDLLRTADGHDVVPAIGSEAQFRGFCAILGRPELADDLRYATNKQRVRYREELLTALAPLVAAQKRDALLAACHRVRVPIGAVRTLDEVLSAPEAQALLLEREVNGKMVRSVRTVVFAYEAPSGE